MNSSKKEAMQIIANGTKLLVSQLRRELELLELYDKTLPTIAAHSSLSRLSSDLFTLRCFVDEL